MSEEREDREIAAAAMALRQVEEALVDAKAKLERVMLDRIAKRHGVWVGAEVRHRASGRRGIVRAVQPVGELGNLRPNVYVEVGGGEHATWTPEEWTT